MATNFRAIWDSVTPADSLPQMYMGITESLLNDYLAKHRTQDSANYSVTKEFSGPNGANFSVKVIAGIKSNLKDLVPLQIDLSPLDSAAGKKQYVPVHEYPSSQTGPFAARKRASLADPLAVIASDCRFEFSWKRAGGAKWQHVLEGVDFRIDAEAQLSESNGTHMITFRATSISIARDDYDGLGASIATALTANSVDDCADKIEDLFLSLLQIASVELAANLAGSLEVPAFQVGDFSAYIHLFRVTDNMIVVGAALDGAALSSATTERFHWHAQKLHRAFEQDIEDAGGALSVLYGRDVASRIDLSDPALFVANIKRYSRKNKGDVLKRLPKTRALIDDLRVTSEARRNSGRLQKPRTVSAPDSIAVAVSEFFLDSLVSKFGNSAEKECTKTLSLKVVKGRLCYEFSSRNADIEITGSGLKGAVDIYAFAGLEYWIKKFWDCSWSWDGPHKSGIGVQGRPSVTLATRATSAGLSIKADFSLKGVKLITGDKIVDEILKVLSPLFMSVLEAFLDALAGILTFVVLPVELRSSSQKTYLSLSKFQTGQYVRTVASPPPGSQASQFNFLMVTADSNAK